jgi:hemerythrin
VNISVIDGDHSKFIDIVNKAIVAKQHNDNVEKVKDVLNFNTTWKNTTILPVEQMLISTG